VNHHYRDITDKLGTPLWWDEHGVPRYCDFSPDAASNIYGREVALLDIRCQNCGAAFKVCVSSSPFDSRQTPLADAVRDQTLHYGDPPNAGCCAAGPTMNSVPQRVLEFWHCRGAADPVRVAELEIAIEAEWWSE